MCPKCAILWLSNLHTWWTMGFDVALFSVPQKLTSSTLQDPVEVLTRSELLVRTLLVRKTSFGLGRALLCLADQSPAPLVSAARHDNYCFGFHTPVGPSNNWLKGTPMDDAGTSASGIEEQDQFLHHSSNDDTSGDGDDAGTDQRPSGGKRSRAPEAPSQAKRKDATHLCSLKKTGTESDSITLPPQMVPSWYVEDEEEDTYFPGKQQSTRLFFQSI
jgi:hypothetical protein